MAEKTYCHICGKTMKGDVCKTCKAEPTEKFLAECRGARYKNDMIISTYVNIILTDSRLLAFEDIKGALTAGVKAGLVGGSGGGIVGAAATGASSLFGSPTERIVTKGVNGSLKFEAPRSSVTGQESVINKKGVQHTFINVTGEKPFRVALGNSFDGSITSDMFRMFLDEWMEG